MNTIIRPIINHKIENNLRKEFKAMDRDGGGFVDMSELTSYIIKERTDHKSRKGIRHFVTK